MSDQPAGTPAPAEPEAAPAQASFDAPIDIRNVSLSVIAVLAAVLMLQFMQSVLIPVVLGVLISYALSPVVEILQRAHIPRVVGAMVAVSLFVAIIGFAAYTFSDEAMEVIRDVPATVRGVTETLKRGERPGQPDGALQEIQKAATEIDKATAEATQPTVKTPNVTKVEVVEPAFRATDYLWMGGAGLVGFVGQFAVILFLVYFLLVTDDLYKRKMVKIAGPTLSQKKITVQILSEINRQIENFIKVQVLTSVIVGAATGLALWGFGVEHPVIWGVLAGIFNSVPYLGPIFVSGALTVVAYMQFQDFKQAAYVGATAMTITSLEGFLLTPALMSRAAQMNPVAIFVGLLFWSWVWGVWGTILAVPMLMMIKAICDHIEDLQPIGELLGD